MAESPPPGNDYRSESPPWPVVAPSAGAGGYRTSRLMIVIVALCAAMIGAAVVALVAATNHRSGGTAASTESVRVITPAPVAAGFLIQDYAVETQPGYQRQMSTLRHGFASLYGLTSSAIALYSGQLPGVLGPASYVTIFYLGFNTPKIENTSRAITAVMRSEAHAMTNVVRVPIGGGPGDTAYACLTGIDVQGPVSACGWATDRTVGVMFFIGSDPQAKKLIALMRKMRPDLVRG